MRHRRNFSDTIEESSSDQSLLQKRNSRKQRESRNYLDTLAATHMSSSGCPIVSRYATAWAVSLEGALNVQQSWAILCRYRCRTLKAEVPKRLARKFRRKTTLTTLGRRRNARSHWKKFWVSSTLGNQKGGEPMRPQSEEPRGKRACALTARGPSISKAMKELVGGAAPELG